MRILPLVAVPLVAVAAWGTSFALSAPALAATPTPTPTVVAPITVVIPGTPSPSPTSTSGGGTGGGDDGGELPTFPDDGSCAPVETNADGSPIPSGSLAEDPERLDIDKDQALAGDWLVGTATGFQPGELGQVVAYPGAVVIASFTIGAGGEFDARFQLPADTPTGERTLEVTGWKSGCVAAGTVTIVNPPPPGTWIIQGWLYAVVGGLLVGAASLAFFFRAVIIGWFAPKAAA